MPTLIAGVVAVILLYSMLQMFRAANPAVLARAVKIGGGILALAVAAFTGIKGELEVAIPLGVFGGSSHRDTAMLAQPQPPKPEQSRPMRGSDSGVGGIEIVLPNGARLSVDAFVNEKALSRVLRAMKGAT